MGIGAAAVAGSAAQPMNAAEAEAAGECDDQRREDGNRDADDDQKGGACEQNGGRSLQDRVDHSDDCLEKYHLA